MFTDIMLNLNYDVNTLVTNIMNVMMPGKVMVNSHSDIPKHLLKRLKLVQGIDQLK